MTNRHSDRPGFLALISIRTLSILIFVAAIAPVFAQIQVSSNATNFGQVNQGEPISTKFNLRNSGTKPVTITGLEFSTPGMNARVKQVIEADSSAEILISWDSSRLRGEVEGQAILTFDDPANPQIVLTLSGTVVPSIEILPRPAVYISQFKGEEKSASLKIRSNQQKPLQLLRLESMGEHFKAEYEVLKEGQLFQINITIPAETAIGRYRESLLVHTDNPQLKLIHLEVNTLVKADVFFNPEVVDFGLVSRARIKSSPEALDFLTQTVVISHREGLMSTSIISIDIPFVWAKLVPEGRSEIFRLDVGLDAEKAFNGRFEGHVVFSTDDPDFSQVVIPVIGEISN